MLTDKEIEFVREWAASGNEGRLLVDIPRRYDDLVVRVDSMTCELSPASLTIAKQAEEIRELRAKQGQADHYRHVADCAQQALGLPRVGDGDDDVAPVDVGKCIAGLLEETNRLRDAFEKLSNRVEFLGDDKLAGEKEK